MSPGSERLTRRDAIARLLAAGAAGLAPGWRLRSAARPRSRVPGFPDPARHWRGDSSVAAALGPSQAPPRVSGRERDKGAERPPIERGRAPADLARRFRDLRRHFVFEYYPWYSTDPWFHWDEAGRTPPDDLASTYMPLLGAYDSRDRAVLERHARWIAETGAGAIDISWWGPGSFTDAATHLVMDVMRDHDIHVAFHLEPYRADRTVHYVDDLRYLLREYGDRRRWDAFLMLENADGRQGPVFKSFRTILPRTVTDCHGVVHVVPDYVVDSEWRRRTDAAREELRRSFDHVTLLADSLDAERTRAAGFDGLALYDPFVAPDTWPAHARVFAREGLVFSFNVNPGADIIPLRQVEPDSCYRPPRFEPGGPDLDWGDAGDRERARALSEARIDESFETALRLAGDPSLSNARRGFLLVYINSFNEWHEGHQFEPMRDERDLRPSERPFLYHNPADGHYRLNRLGSLLQAFAG